MSDGEDRPLIVVRIPGGSPPREPERVCLCGASCWRVGGEAGCAFIETVECGHPAGCRCPRVALEVVPCGHGTMAVCAAALRVQRLREEPNSRFWWNGAATHVFADLLGELRNAGYVLARRTGA